MDTATHPDLDAPITTLLLTREFDASPALMFKLWTQPEHIVRWWGCAETGDVTFTRDLRVGGEFAAVMRLSNGHTHRITGVYCKIEAPTLLVFTWGWENTDGFQGGETLVTVAFKEKNGRTELTLRHESFATEGACAAHGQGWGASLDRLAGYVASQVG